jgi:hypothetical protein
MHRELMEIADLLLRVERGGEISRAELMGLSFVAHSEMRTAMAEACITLLEFARDRDLRSRDPAHDRVMRLQAWVCLEYIIEICERSPPAPAQSASIH